MKLLLLLCFFQQTDTAKMKRMGDILIKAAKPIYQQGPYGSIVNVGNDPLSPGSSALSALERAPGIVVDHRYNSFTLNGKSGVTVLIDGKLTHMSSTQLMNYLSGLNADDIERIEIMTTPPANFDAEGNAGILNIVLKRNRKKGSHASLTASGGFGRWAKASGSLRLEHNTGKVNLWTAYSYSYDHSETQLVATGSEVVPQWSGLTTMSYLSNSESYNQSHFVRAGMDVDIDPRTSASVAASYYYGGSTNHAANGVVYDFLPDSVLTFGGVIDGKSTWKNPWFSLTLDRKMGKGGKLSLDAYYDLATAGGASTVSSSFVDGHGAQVDPGNPTYAPDQRGYSSGTQHDGTLKIDYTGTLSPRIQLEAGLKYDASRHLGSSGILSFENGTWVNRGGTASDLLVREGVGAAYASFHFRIDTLTTLIAGFRYEYSRTVGSNAQTGTDTVNRTINGLFPDIFLSRALDDHQGLVLSYTKRISRPSYDDLTPNISYNDPLSVFTGNPLLQPTLSHTLRLGYHYRGYAVSLLASRDVHPIVRYQVYAVPGSDLIYIGPVNLDHQDGIRLELVLPVRLTSWWDVNASLSGGWTHYRATYNPVPYDNTFIAGSGTATSTVRLPRRFLVEVSGAYSSRNYYGALYNYPNTSLSLALKKDLPGKRGSLLLSASDLLRMQYHSYLGDVTTDAFQSRVAVWYRPESWWGPVVKLSYVWAFGRP
jgi:hypothetical protein